MAQGDVKQAFGASGTFTLTAASLATSSTRVAGRESTALAVSSLQPVMDVLIGGKITLGTSPTANKFIELWVYAAVKDDPIYPDGFTGSDSNRSVTSENVRTAALVMGAGAISDSTSDRTYWFAPFSVAALFGGVLPTHFGVWLVHDTGVNLNATAGNHAIYYTPVYHQIAQS